MRRSRDDEGTWVDPDTGLQHWVVDTDAAPSGRVFCTGLRRPAGPFTLITCLRCLRYWLMGRGSLDHIRGQRADLVIIDEAQDYASFTKLPGT